jgi:uncharacterized protein YbbC (DUF1343 family)
VKALSFLVLTFALAVTIHAQPQPRPTPVIKTGIDVLVERNFSLLSGKRVGLITNPSGVTNTLVSTVDILARATDFKLIALYGPEHGVRGDVAAGRRVDSTTDSVTGIPVYSLYGKLTKPTPEMLKGVDVLVYDIQDIGVRSYSYISTMAASMEAAAANNIEFIVLDRPDPLTGNKIEGNILEKKYKSFVGMFPIPYVYGMTCGELATLLNDEGWLEGGKRCRLTVVKMNGWKRSMWWEDTGLQWVPTSPHIPNAPTALFCAATGILGELDAVNIGVGYTLPFQIVGTPWIDASRFAQMLNAKKIAGLFFRPITYTPFYAAMQGKQVKGVQIHILDREKANLVNVQLTIAQTLAELNHGKSIFAMSDSSRIKMFDKVMGTDAVRLALESNVPVEQIVSRWGKDIDRFIAIRKKYLMYE